jgi:hypothetical protein
MRIRTTFDYKLKIGEQKVPVLVSASGVISTAWIGMEYADDLNVDCIVNENDGTEFRFKYFNKDVKNDILNVAAGYIEELHFFEKGDKV